MSGHYIEKCDTHGTVLAQCRCADKNKATNVRPCPGPPACVGSVHLCMGCGKAYAGEQCPLCRTFR